MTLGYNPHVPWIPTTLQGRVPRADQYSPKEEGSAHVYTSEVISMPPTRLLLQYLQNSLQKCIGLRNTAASTSCRKITGCSPRVVSKKQVLVPPLNSPLW